MQYADNIISNEVWSGAQKNTSIGLSADLLTATDVSVSGGSVTVAATATPASTNSLVTHLDISTFTVPASSTALAVFLNHGEQANGVSGVAVHWDSAGTNQAMTLVGTKDSANTNVKTSIYGLVSPTIGNKLLHATWTGAAPAAIEAVALFGTLTSSVAAAFTHFNSASGTSGAPAVTITGGAAGDMAVGSICSNNTAITAMTATGSALIYNASLTQLGNAAARAPGAATVAFTSTPNGSEWVAAGCDIVAATVAAAYHPGFASLGVQNGHYYWETVQTLASTSSALGIGNTSSTVASGTRLGSGTDTIGVRTDGTVWNGGSQVATFAAPGTGANVRCCWALILDQVTPANCKLWMRVGAAGNWNNAAIGSQNPAGPTGGLAVPASVTGFPVVPGYETFTPADTVTGVFASSSFVGTVPTGFTSIGGGAVVYGPFTAGSTVPGPVVPPAQNFTLMHPTIATAGTFPISIRDSVSGASAMANVVVTVASGLVTSPDGTTLTSPTGAIVDANTPTKVTWTLQSGGASGLQIYRDGTLDTNTSHVQLLLWFGGNIYQEAGTAAPFGWWQYTGVGGDPWVAIAGDPRLAGAPVVTDISLSSTSVQAGAPAGTVVGTITVVMSSGAFTGTFQPLTGTDAASFQIVGSQLQTTAALTVAHGAYAFNINTLLNGGTFSKPESVTATAAAGTVTNISLTNMTTTVGLPAGTVVGTIVVTMSSGSFGGTLALSGTNAADFSIDASMRLVTASSLSVVRMDAITITATY